jgi:hypothetical protein
MDIDSHSFRDFIDIKDKSGAYLGDLFYDKVKSAISKDRDLASLFTSVDNDPMNPGTSQIFMCSIDSEKFPIFLQEYLRWCEGREEYEKCSEIMGLNIL